MVRTLVVALALVLGLHHAAMAAVAPQHHATAPAACACDDDSGEAGHAGFAEMVMTACLAVAAVGAVVPTLRQRLLGTLPRLATPVRVWAARAAPRPRARPPASPPSRLAVLRC